jgi:hypothetical protein
MDDFGNHQPKAQNDAERPLASATVCDSGRFFQSVDWLGFWVTTSLTFAVYVYTLAPEVTLEMSGMLSTAAMYGGVAHPPGFPVWTMYAWLFTKILPFSNIAWRISVSSAVAGGVTSGLIALMVSRGGLAIVEGLRRFSRLGQRDERLLRLTSGIVAGMVFGFNGAFWLMAVTVDTMALPTALFATALCLLFRWSYSVNRMRWFYLAFFIFSLANSANPILLPAALGLPFVIACADQAIGRDLFFGAVLVTAVTGIMSAQGYFPLIPPDHFAIRALCTWSGVLSAAICLGLIIKTRRVLTRWAAMIFALVFSALGALPYLSLPMAAMTTPPSNWGYARTVEGFFHVLSRGQFEKLTPTDNLPLFFGQLGKFCAFTLSTIGLINVFLALLPFCFIFRMRRKEQGVMAGFTACFLAMSLLMLFLLNPPPDRQAQGMVIRFFIPSFLIMTIWTGFGLILLGTIIVRPKPPPLIIPEHSIPSSPSS